MDPNHPLHNFYDRVIRLIDQAAAVPKIARDPVASRRIAMIRNEITDLGCHEIVSLRTSSGPRLFIDAVDEKLAEIQSMIRAE